MASARIPFRILIAGLAAALAIPLTAATAAGASARPGCPRPDRRR
jgi:hypothetical protein